MPLFGKLSPTGVLSDIQNITALRTWADGSTDVPLATLPTTFDPWTYDAANKLAVAAHRKPLPLYTIYTNLKALTVAQQTAIWNDISSGVPAKYLLDTGPNTAAIAALDWSVTDSGAMGAALTAARFRIVTCYVQDVPKYLVNPIFAPTVNVPGDQPAP